MRPENHRAGFRRAVGVGHRGVRQSFAQRRHQARTHRRRAHAREFDAGEVGARHQFGFAQHHRHHRRHGGEPGTAVAADRLDISARVELRQQHDRGVRSAGKLGERQRIHVVERRGDEIAVAVEPVGEPRLDHPDVALVRQHDALRCAGRSGRIEKHRRFVRRRIDRGERSWIEQGVEIGAERDAWDIRRTLLRTLRVAEDEPGIGVAQDEMDGRARKLEIRRHRDQAGAHDAVIGRKIFGAIGGQYRDAIAAPQSALAERARDAVRHVVDLLERELSRAAFAAEIDDGDLGKIAVAGEEIAEI